jgi:hypothetical protein
LVGSHYLIEIVGKVEAKIKQIDNVRLGSLRCGSYAGVFLVIFAKISLLGKLSNKIRTS